MSAINTTTIGEAGYDQRPLDVGDRLESGLHQRGITNSGGVRVGLYIVVEHGAVVLVNDGDLMSMR